MRFYVNKSDIEKGERAEPKTCAIARCIKRYGKRDVCVDCDSVRIGNKHYNLCPKGQDLIENWDVGRHVDPCHIYISPKVND